MTGFIADVTRFPAGAITSNVDWTGLDRIKTLPLVDAAVSSRIGTQADPVTITITLSAAREIGYAGLIGINAEQWAGWRLQILSSTSTVWDSRVDGADREVMPSLLAWGDFESIYADNFFRGDLPHDQWISGRPSIHALPPSIGGDTLIWSLWGDAFQPDGSPASYYRIGYAPIGAGIAIDRKVGSQDTDDPRAEVTAVPGGDPSIEPGAAAQTNTVELSLLGRAERDALAIILRGAGADLPLVWLPDMDDPAANFWWGGLRRVGGATSHRWSRPIYTDTQLTLTEITA